MRLCSVHCVTLPPRRAVNSNWRDVRTLAKLNSNRKHRCELLRSQSSWGPCTGRIRSKLPPNTHHACQTHGVVVIHCHIVHDLTAFHQPRVVRIIYCAVRCRPRLTRLRGSVRLSPCRLCGFDGRFRSSSRIVKDFQARAHARVAWIEHCSERCRPCLDVTRHRSSNRHLHQHQCVVCMETKQRLS